MPRLLLLVLSISLLGCSQVTETVEGDPLSKESVEREKELIMKVLSNQQAAWNEGDREKFMIGYLEADSLMFVGIDGIIYGYNNTLERYHRNYATKEDMGRLNFTVNELKPVTSDVYFMVGEYYLTREEVGDTNGIFTLVWKKLNGNWVIVSDHSESAEKVVVDN